MHTVLTNIHLQSMTLPQTHFHKVNLESLGLGPWNGFPLCILVDIATLNIHIYTYNTHIIHTLMFKIFD